MNAELKQKAKKMPHTVELEIPEGIEVRVEKRYQVHVKKGDTAIQRRLAHKKISSSVEGNKIKIQAQGSSRTEYKMIQTFKAHLKNMLRGVAEPHVYILKICSGHFPMNVSVKGNVFEIKNFLGEKVPRTYKLREGVKVQVKSDQVIVESPDKETAGMTAGAIEQLASIKKKDRRIFQDGIFIINKDGKAIQ